MAKILKLNIEAVLAGQNDITIIEKRLEEIDKARNDMVNLIVSGACGEDTLDAEFGELYEEEEELNAQLQVLRSRFSTNTQNRVENAMQEIENAKLELVCFDNVLVRKLIECIRVLDKTHIQIIFKVGHEVTAEMEK